MVYQILNEYLHVAARRKGMELCSIRSVHSGTEYLWQGDPSVWAGQAPVLFPVIGALKDGIYSFNNRTYSMPKHGFIRHNEQIQLEDQTGTSLTFLFASDPEIQKIYPFDFEFRVRYSLDKNKLITEHIIRNTGDSDLWYSTGGHPAFNCPVKEGEEYEDYLISFEKNETLHTPRLNTNGLITDNTELIMDNSSELPLRKNLFDQDALIFTELYSRKVTLFSKVSGPVLSMSFPDFPSFGIWAKPGAPYVCLEPWSGLADHISSDQKLINKIGILRLGGGMKRTHRYTLSFFLQDE